MPVPLPDWSVWGIAEYMLFAVGLAAGMALFAEPMSRIESLIANLRNGG